MINKEKTADSLERSLEHSLKQEWHSLHNSYEHSETLALLIKLVALLVFLFGVSFYNSPIIPLLIAMLWLQEAIWKTLQGRTEQRLIAIEKARAESDESAVLCYYSNWNNAQRSLKQLLLEYFSNALRPTIAYPYIILMIISIGVWL